MNKIAKLRKTLPFLFLGMFSFSPTIWANPNDISIVQQNAVRVTGTVVDSSGEPVIGANVLEKGTTVGTITDIDGNFSLSVHPKAVLQISFLGYVKQEFPIGGKTSFSITLKDDTEVLDEVVVVGFGTQKKVNLTGSIGTVNAAALKERPVANAVQALQGLVPGLNITTPKGGGQLDATKGINIRGTATIDDGSSGDPLILIDGMEGDLNTINPQDIDNISVLKDAAASSIYGSRAPFGVILVTTKSGKQGRAVINYNNSFRFNTPVMMPKSMNSYQFMNYMNDANYNSEGKILFDAENIQAAKEYMEGLRDPLDTMYGPDDDNYKGKDGKWDYDRSYGNVDWLDQYYKKWTNSQEHNVSVSGGTDKLSYYVSGNFLTQDGLLRYGTEDYSRYNITAKINAQLTKYVKIGYSTRWSRTDYDKPTGLNDSFFQDVMRRGRPNRPIYDPSGYLDNDVNLIGKLQDGGRTKTQNDALSQQLSVTITPLKNWNIIGEFNIKTNNDWKHEEEFKVYSHYASNPEDVYLGFSSFGNDKLYEESYKYTYLNLNVYSNYSITFNQKHNLGATIGFQTEQQNKRGMDGSRTGLISTDLPVLGLTTDTKSTTLKGEYQNWRTAGFFGRANYDYDGRYLLEVNARYDGSSRFRSDKRWVWTPSASLGWNIAREAFWGSAAEYVQMLKFRASYGVLSNQNTTNWYPTYETMEVKAANGGWLVGGEKPNTSSSPTLVSALLTWEKVKTTNIGLDFGAFDNRLTGSYDYFIRRTTDMVGPGFELPSTFGTDVPKTNNTELKTMGWELELGWRDRVNDFSYGVKFNLSDSRTKIVRYGNPTNTIDRYREGTYIGEIYGYTTIGVAKTDAEMQDHLASLPNGGQTALGSDWKAGDIMYADLNGDDKISGGSRTLDDLGDLKIIGNKNPRFRTGITIDLAYKGFDLSMFWQGVLKRDYYIDGAVFWGMNSIGQWWSMGMQEHLDYFRGDAENVLGQNLNSYYPRPTYGDKNRKTQTRYLQDASYMRLKNLQVGYTFPKAWTNKVLLQNLRIFVSGENLLTCTKLSNTVDPETVMDGVQQGGAIYPLSRTVSFGLNVNF